MTQGNPSFRVLTCAALVLLVIAFCLVGKNLGKPTHANDQQPHHTAAAPLRSARTNPKPPLPASAPHPPAALANESSSTPPETTVAFHASRAKLMRSHRQLMQGLAGATPEERQQAMAKWHKENSEALKAQQQPPKQIHSESRPVCMVDQEPRIPDNATPELREFLTTRHALMKDRAEMMSQLRDATLEEQQNTMKAWHESYSERLAALRSLASKTSLSASPSHNP